MKDQKFELLSDNEAEKSGTASGPTATGKGPVPVDSLAAAEAALSRGQIPLIETGDFVGL